MGRPCLVFASIATIVLMACAAERPPVEGGSDGDDSTTLEDRLVLGPSPSSDPPPPEIEVVEQCAPGDVRQCRIVYYDVDGRKHCPITAQYCRASGRGWLACGAPPDPVSAR